ncbi:hypothetical protein IU474_32930 [Nocardia otitidiscaviarum]|nr:hypothetical protein [Nocardia otitidiscaviarum]
MVRFRRALVALAGSVLAAVSGGGIAGAAPAPAVLGGGSGIVVASEPCSLTMIGYDGGGRLVGLTAGHCTHAGAPVRAERSPETGVLGTVVFSDRGQGLDYAVIEFAPGRVNAVRTVGATTIAGIGTAPGFGATVCADGRSSGFDCGMVWGSVDGRVYNQSCSIPGDSGGPVTVGDRLVGMNQGHLKPWGIDLPCVSAAFPLYGPAYFRPITEILHALDVAGGIGAGLRPV